MCVCVCDFQVATLTTTISIGNNVIFATIVITLLCGSQEKEEYDTKPSSIDTGSADDVSIPTLKKAKQRRELPHIAITATGGRYHLKGGCCVKYKSDVREYEACQYCLK